jgi:hypothetical protein
MERVRQLWQYVIIKPFTLLFYGFFQPIRYSKELEKLYQETEPMPSKKKNILWARNFLLPLCLSIFFFTLLTLMISILLSGLIHLQPPIALLQEIANSLRSVFPATLLASGLAALLTYTGLSTQTTSKERVEIYCLVVTGSIIVSILFASLIDDEINVILRGLILGLSLGVLLDTIIGIFQGTNRKFKDLLANSKGYTSEFQSTVSAIMIGLTPFMLFFMIIFLLLHGTDIISGFAALCVFIICCISGYYRLPFYLVSGPSFRKAYLASLTNPSQVFTYLHHSSLHWDERVHVPLPYLKQTLLIAAQQDIKQAGKEIIFIVGERPLQIRPIRTIYPVIILRTLATFESLRDIADLSSHFTAAFSQKKRLIEPEQEKVFKPLSTASQQAANYDKAVSRRARIKQLEQMQAALRAILPDAVFDNEELNTVSGRVVEKWIEIVQKEQDRLKNLPQEIGHIENPYNPGTVPKPGDSLFVGRRDVVQQLESALNREDGIPPFLLNGERRIGKTSVLRQLSTMLGAQYLPVFYDLQRRGISSSTARFLETIATEINAVVTDASIKIDTMEYKQLYKASKENEAASYSIFEKWLKHVEYRLKQEDKTLLLAFDEFEKLAESGQAQYLDLNLLLDWFRSVIQNYSRFALLFSGVHTLGEMGNMSGISWPSYFVNVQTLRVSFLHPEEARQLITQQVPDSPSKEIFGSDVVEKIIRETGCHPFLIQAVCSTLINKLNLENRINTEVQDVTVAVDQVVENWWDSYFRDLWDRTNEEQRRCLTLLKTVGEADISLIEQQSDLDKRTVRRTIQTLHRRDLIRCDQDGAYRIAAPIFAEWVERSLYS